MVVRITRYVKNPGSWIDYEIHFDNDVVHCVRYRRLCKLYIDCVRSVKTNAKLGQENASIAGLPPFPPKIVFISKPQIERRRELLENWIQAIAKLPQTNCVYQQYANFVSECKAQSVTSEEKRQLPVFFLDGSFVSVITNGKRVSETVAKSLQFPSALHKKFCIYLQINTSQGWQLKHRLRPYDQVFEYLKPTTRLCFTRDFWNATVDQALLESAKGSEFLQAEAKFHFKSGGLIARTELEENYLQQFLDENKPESFLHLARCQPYYGCFTFGPLHCSYPAPQTKCFVVVGDFKLRFRIFHRDALEATISTRHIAYTKVSTDRKVLKVHLQKELESLRAISFITSDASLISSIIASMLDPV